MCLVFYSSRPRVATGKQGIFVYGILIKVVSPKNASAAVPGIPLFILLMSLAGCVSTDESGHAFRERASLRDVSQTMIDQKVLLSARPISEKVCPESSRDMKIDPRAITRAGAYVGRVMAQELRGVGLPATKLSVAYEEADLRESLVELGGQIGINIIAGDEVSGLINVTASDQRISKILPMMLAAGGFDYIYNGSYIYVGSPMRADGASGQAFNMRHSYKTVSASPTAIVASLPPPLKAYVTANEAMGIVFVAAPRVFFSQLLRDVISLDRPSRQIRLKLSVSYISDDAIESLGRQVGGTGLSIAGTLDPIQPSFAQGVYSKISFDQFLNNIDLLAKTGEAEIKAEPQITVLDGEKASFASRESALIRRTDGNLDKSNAMDGGVSMILSPRIVDQDFVQLTIEKATSGELNAAKDGANEHTMSSTVRVKSGETLVVGGMRQAKVKTTIRKVPLLGDIPYLGWFFKTRSETTLNSQVIFAIMPEITCN